MIWHGSTEALVIVQLRRMVDSMLSAQTMAGAPCCTKSMHAEENKDVLKQKRGTALLSLMATQYDHQLFLHIPH